MLPVSPRVRELAVQGWLLEARSVPSYWGRVNVACVGKQRPVVARVARLLASPSVSRVSYIPLRSEVSGIRRRRRLRRLRRLRPLSLSCVPFPCPPCPCPPCLTAPS